MKYFSIVKIGIYTNKVRFFIELFTKKELCLLAIETNNKYKYLSIINSLSKKLFILHSNFY